MKHADMQRTYTAWHVGQSTRPPPLVRGIALGLLIVAPFWAVVAWFVLT